MPEHSEQAFEREALLHLGQMLQILKQERPERREQLQEQCQQLSDLGQDANLYQWVTLLQTAQKAIANDDNPVQETAKRIIKDIKRALEKVVSGCGDEIKLTQELQSLAAVEPQLEEPSALDCSPEADFTPTELLSLFAPQESAPEAPADDFGDYWSAAASEADESTADAASLFDSSEEDTDEISSLFAEAEEPRSELIDLFEPAPQSQEEPVGDDWQLSELFGDEDVALDEVADLFAQHPDETEREHSQNTEPIQPLSSPSPTAVSQDWELYPQFDELDELLTSAPVQDRTAFVHLEALLTHMGSEGTDSEFNVSDSSAGDRANSLPDSEPPQLNANQDAASHPASSKPLATFEQTMRVPVKQLDTLNNLIGELVVNRNTLEQDWGRLRQFLDSLLQYVQGLSDIGGRMQDLYERSLLEGALLATRSGGERHDSRGSSADNGGQGLNALEMDRFTGFHTLSQEMIELIVRVRESASDIQFLVDNGEQVSLSLQQITSQLQEGLNKARMVPFSQTAERLPRAVREISRRLNKQAQLKVEGRDVLIDKMLLEQLYDPMTHLVNNAITHGIESPEVREQAGKPACGQVTISAFLQGNQTIISVADDGAGIDARKVKAKAIEKGLLSPAQAKTLGHQDFYEFLFHPGFSTKDKADDFAGRGVGMDVVRTSLEAIRGKIGIDSTLGKGTTFTVRLPLTLSICKALCCLSNQFRIAFPMDGVEDMQDYAAADIQTDADGQPCVPWRNTLLPFRPLKELLTYSRSVGRRMRSSQSDDTISIVVLRGAGTLLAVEVERVIGEQEIVIKQIEGPVPKPLGIAGATVLGDGSVMAIGDVLELIDIAQGNRGAEGQSWQKTVIYAPSETFIGDEKPSVLIVDDSITVRELLSISFSNAGYRVEQARDGSEAWEKLRSGLACDIIFCDVEMPRMNGLELLSCLQKDERLATIPVALLTSRGAARHRQVAVELGARGYFTKPYTEKDLLDAAHKMIAGEVLVSGSPRKAPEAPSRETNHAEPTVLIVDDSVMVREMLSMTFKKAGYQVEQARDGQDALEKLRSNLSIDVVFCDIEMPRMNGLDLLTRLQQESTLSQVPVAMVTSRGAERHRKIAQERGAKGYFTKPYIEKTLLEAAKQLMKGEDLFE